VHFALDLTAPTITVTGVTEGQCGAEGFVPETTVEDAHLDTWTTSLDGVEYISGTPITAEGSHTLLVQAADEAGNTAETTVHFIIDRTAPVLTVSGVADGGFYSGPVTPEIAYSDANLAGGEGTLDGNPYEPGTPITAEGTHVLAGSVWDCAGNTTSVSVTFTIDLTAPVISVTGVSDGECTIHDVTPTITVTDAHLDGWSATLDGAAFESGTTVTAEGTHVLVVTADDLAGHEATATVTFKIDRTNPVVSISGVTEGTYYNVGVIPNVSVSDANLLGSNVTLNGQPFTSGTPITADGDYMLSAAGWDCAGNSASASVSFVVDRTPPSILVTGVVEGGTHNLGTAANITVTDAHLDTWSATLNGNPYTSGTPITEVGSYVLVVQAFDLATNEATRTVNFSIQGMALPEFKFAVCAAEGVSIQNNAVVRSKDCQTGALGDHGYVGADGNVSMGNNAAVRGGVTTGGNLSMGNNSHVWGDAYLGGTKTGGGVVHGSITYPTPDPSPCSCTYDLAALLDEKEQYNDNDALAGDPAIAPYLVNGGLELPNNAHVTLPAGDYYLDHVNLANNALLGAAGGDVYLYVRHSFVMSNNARLESPCASGPMFKIFATTDTGAGEQFVFTNNSTVRALVYAPNAAVTFKNNTTFCGAVFAKTATLNQNATVYLDESLWAGVPELWCE